MAHQLLRLTLPVGFILLAIQGLLPEQAPPFLQGLLIGLATGLLLLGIIYSVYCLAKGINPYRKRE